MELAGALRGEHLPHSRERRPPDAGYVPVAVSMRPRSSRSGPPVARLLRMAAIVPQTQRLRTAMGALARETTAVCRADRCSIFLWRDDALVSLVSVYAAGLASRDLRRSFKSLRLGRPDDVPAFARARRD